MYYNIALHIPLVMVTRLTLIAFYHIKYCVNALVFVPQVVFGFLCPEVQLLGRKIYKVIH